MGDKVKADEVAEFLEQSRGLERRWIDELLRSRKVAWRLVAILAVITIASVASVAALAPLKEPPEMYVVRVDKSTGMVEHVSRLAEHEQEYGERTAKFWLNMYVLSCEGYNWWTIQHQYETCALLSNQDVQRAYGKKFEGPNSLTDKYAKHTNIDVDVHSITLGFNQTATVRFSTVEREVATARPKAPKHWVATISYQYVNVPVNEDVWRFNPLGFHVTHYAVDADLSR